MQHAEVMAKRIFFDIYDVSPPVVLLNTNNCCCVAFRELSIVYCVPIVPVPPLVVSAYKTSSVFSSVLYNSYKLREVSKVLAVTSTIPPPPVGRSRISGQDRLHTLTKIRYSNLRKIETLEHFDIRDSSAFFFLRMYRYRDTRHHKLSTSGLHNRNARQVADVENNLITSCNKSLSRVINLLIVCGTHFV